MDIVEWLRDGKPCRWTGVCGEMSAVGGCTCGEAADEIEKLREELSRLRKAYCIVRDSYEDTAKEVARLRNCDWFINKLDEQIATKDGEIERLRKENQKLALDLIAVLGQWHDNYEQNDDK